jgi:hypothetical protein
MLWKAKVFKDDTPVNPFITLNSSPKDKSRLWGINLDIESASSEGAYKPIVTIKERSDIKKIIKPRFTEETEKIKQIKEKIFELTDGVLPIFEKSDSLSWGPFEYAVSMRGLENLIMDMLEASDFVHELMSIITDGFVAYQVEREKAGKVFTDIPCITHVAYDKIAIENQKNTLKGCWAYIHAQSSGIISPEMYAKFVHPYNCKLANLVGKVYYHGCEDLSKKCDIIKNMPNLIFFHVSPWTPAEPVAKILSHKCAFEVHSNPSEVLFDESSEMVIKKLKQKNDVFKNESRVLTLGDIEKVDDKFTKLTRWIEIARNILQN